MVSSEAEPIQGTSHRRNAQRYVVLGAVACVVAVCAVAVIISVKAPTTNLVDKPDELYMDSMKVANKILSAQKFKKADEEQRKAVVKSILAGGHEHKSGQKIVAKVATIVANNHLSYHQRMEAMKKLLDDQTDAIKLSPTLHIKESHHTEEAHGKRGRTGKRSKAQVAADNKKAMVKGLKLLAAKTKAEHAHVLHASSAHDKKVHAESEHTAADPSKAAAWMKKELEAEGSKAAKVHDKHGHLLHATSEHDKKVHSESEHKAADPAEAAAWMKKQLAEKKGLKKHLGDGVHVQHRLHMSAKDEAIKKASEKAVDPSAANKFFQKDLSSKKAAVKHAAAHKKAAAQEAAKKSQPLDVAPESKSAKLIKWAEAHGLPKKLVVCVCVCCLCVCCCVCCVCV
jgi:hypothetical protein